mmetsp:Transcript_9879/g.28308  ORF Transcript_9879/g.28308 Transcript_9879/m.28308 type:complete len:274 (+) Transcript_9879:230-1051(+)
MSTLLWPPHYGTRRRVSRCLLCVPLGAVSALHRHEVPHMQQEPQCKQHQAAAAQRVQHDAEWVTVEAAFFPRGIDVLVNAEGSEASRRHHHEHEARDLQKCRHQNENGLVETVQIRPRRHCHITFSRCLFRIREPLYSRMFRPLLAELLAVRLDFFQGGCTGTQHGHRLREGRDYQRHVRQHRKDGVGATRALPGDEGAGQNARGKQEDDRRRAEDHLGDVDLDNAATDARRPVGASDQHRHLAWIQARALHDGFDRARGHRVDLDELLDFDP